MGVFRDAGDRWIRGLRPKIADSIGIRPVHTEVDSSGLLPDRGQAPAIRQD